MVFCRRGRRPIDSRPPAPGGGGPREPVRAVRGLEPPPCDQRPYRPRGRQGIGQTENPADLCGGFLQYFADSGSLRGGSKERIGALEAFVVHSAAIIDCVCPTG